MSLFEKTQEQVIQWAKDRQIIPNSTPMAQAMKGVEECAEWLQAATALYVLNSVDDSISCDHAYEQHQQKKEYWKAKFIDGVGDVLVCITNSAALTGVDVSECFQSSYNEIKDRKGTMNAQGIFVKQK
jgi:hypothetical protein